MLDLLFTTVKSIDPQIWSAIISTMGYALSSIGIVINYSKIHS